MSILHVAQIGRRVRESFEAYIPKDDLRVDDAEYEVKVLTRCLAAYAVKAATDCSDADAGGAVIDGGDDNGLDAVFFSDAQNCLVLVQSKWIKDGKSEPDSAETAKFCTGVRDLLNSEFDRFNEKLRRRQPSIENALSNFNCCVHLVLVHTGRSHLADHASRRVNDLLSELNDATELASFLNAGQETVYRQLSEGAAGGAINLEFSLSSWGKIESPHTAFYGTVSGQEVVGWWQQYGDRLFEKNLRSVLGATDVNKQVSDTIETCPDDFWYFNNGITITARSVEKTAAGAGNREVGVFRATGAYVVNGAQTVSTIGRFRGPQEHFSRVRIPLRVISLANAGDDYGATITRTNNTQNRIEARDFASQDPEQIRIRVELQLEGIEYHIARSESFKALATAFDLEEATVALACAAADAGLAVQAKREIGRFWADIHKAPYKRLFNPSVSSLHVYHAVVAHRMIESRIGELIAQLSKRSGKKYGVLVHGNRLIAAAVFCRWRATSQLGVPSLDLQSLKGEVFALVDQVVDCFASHVQAKYADNFLAVVFKNPTKSKDLFDACVSQQSPSQMSLDFALANPGN